VADAPLPAPAPGRRAAVLGRHVASRTALAEQLTLLGWTVHHGGPGDDPDAFGAFAAGGLDLLLADHDLARIASPAWRRALADPAAAPRRRVALLRHGDPDPADGGEQLPLPVKPTALRDLLASDGPAAPGDDAARPASTAGPSLAGLRVLLVEDNPVNQTFARLLLQRQGCDVVLAEHGEAGLAALATGGVDVVLSDVQMPVMDGLTMTREIRAREAGSDAHVPIIGVTAHALASDRDRCLAAGMDGYISKPINAAQLTAVIAELALAPEPAAGPARGPHAAPVLCSADHDRPDPTT
jgi:CheY-like chemotaxis protein